MNEFHDGKGIFNAEEFLKRFSEVLLEMRSKQPDKVPQVFHGVPQEEMGGVGDYLHPFLVIYAGEKCIVFQFSDIEDIQETLREFDEEWGTTTSMDFSKYTVGHYPAIVSKYDVAGLLFIPF